MFQKPGFSEIAVILIVALLIFGPSKLPSLGRSIGESIREFKKSMRDTTDDIVSNDKKA